MSDHIDFGVWAPDEATFWQSWIDGGICTAAGVFADGYEGLVETTRSWPGIIDGVAGWHTNVRVTGALIAQFTYGLVQTSADGTPLSIWDRTWAAEIFQLTEQAAAPETGFPAGYRNSTGVTYADARAFSSPSNVWVS